MIGAGLLGLRGHYFAIGTLGLGIAAAEIAASWDYIGAGSGPGHARLPRRDRGPDPVLLLPLPDRRRAHLLHAALAVCRPLRPRDQRDPGRRGQGRGDGSAHHALQDRRLVRLRVLPRHDRRPGRQHDGLHRPARRGLRGCDLRRLDGADGDPGRQGHALGASDRRRHLPRHPGAVLDLSARLATGRAGPPDRADRGLLPPGHPRLAARAPARVVRPPRRGGVPPSGARDGGRAARGQERQQAVRRRGRQPRRQPRRAGRPHHRPDRPERLGQDDAVQLDRRPAPDRRRLDPVPGAGDLEAARAGDRPPRPVADVPADARLRQDDLPAEHAHLAARARGGLARDVRALCARGRRAGRGAARVHRPLCQAAPAGRRALLRPAEAARVRHGADGRAHAAAAR